MRRRNLENVAVGDGFHLVNGLRCNAISLPDLQIDGLQRVAFPDAIDELARKQINRLVLDVVVPLRQDLAGLYVEDFADVLLGVGPDGLVAPRFGNCLDVGAAAHLDREREQETGNREQGTGNRERRAATVDRLYVNVERKRGVNGERRLAEISQREALAQAQAQAGSAQRPRPIPSPIPALSGAQ